MQSSTTPGHPSTTAQQLETGQLQHPDNEQLEAYQRKWDEELEGFRKLAVKLQAQASSTQQDMQAGSWTAGPPESRDNLQRQLPSPLASPAPAACPASEQLAAAKQQAESMLAEVHAAAVQALSSGTAADSKLLAKQLRLQRNHAFEAAKALLHRAQAA